jgi:hypothetical protein
MAHAPKPLVVLQLRGGDKLGTEAPPYIDVDSPLQRLAGQKNAPINGTCVVLGDDWELSLNASQSAKHWLGCTVINRLQPGYTHFQDRFQIESPASRCFRARRLLVDIEIMAAADALVALMLSNIARIAVLLRECRAPGVGASSVADWLGHDVLHEACIPF